MQFFDEILSFFAPTYCYGCGGCIESNLLLCSECLDICQLLSKEGRCSRCFSEMVSKATCTECNKYPIIYRRGALFEKEAILEGLLREKRRQQKTLAALFTWQFCRLGWPSFDYIATDPSLRGVGRFMAKKWNRPFHRRGNISHNAHLLYLSVGNRRIDFPFSVMMGKVYHLSFFLSN